VDCLGPGPNQGCVTWPNNNNWTEDLVTGPHPSDSTRTTTLRPGNWTTPMYPDNTRGGNWAVTIGQAPTAVLGSNVTIDTLDITSLGGLRIRHSGSNTTLTVVGGSVANAGTLAIDASGSGGPFAILNMTGGTITNSGNITMDGFSVLSGANTLVNIGSILLNGGGFPGNTLSTEAGSITNSGTITLNVASSLNTKATLIDNSGTLAMNATFGAVGVVLNPGSDVNLTGSGRWILSNSTQNNIGGDPGARLIQGANHTIEGAGQLGMNQIALTNHGTIIANQPTALVIDPNASGAINTGTMSASSGGTLTLQGGAFNNAGGLIRANASTVNVNSASVTGGTVQVLGAASVQLSGGTITGGTLDNSGSGIIRAMAGANQLGGTVTNPVGSQIIMDNGAALRLTGGGSYTNHGTFAMNSTFGGVDLIMTAGSDVTLAGTGTLTLSNSSQNNVRADAGERFIHGVNHTIQGAGRIGLNQMALTNHGTILANQLTPLVIDPNASGAINTGTLRASGGATLRLQDGTFTNTGGTIEALNGSTVELTAGATIVGGTLATAGTGVIRNPDFGVATLDGSGITNAGNFQMNFASLTRLRGTLTNNGTMGMNASFGAVTLRLTGGSDVTLTGTGTLTLSDSSQNNIEADAGQRLIHGAGHTIQGAGSIGRNQMALTNHGTIIANQPVGLVIDPNDSGFTNQGTLRANAGSTLTVTDGLTNFTGTTLTGGTYEAFGTNPAGNLRLANANIVTNAATILLDGPSSNLLRHDTGTNALANFATNAAAGRFTLQNGRDFPTAGAFSNAGDLMIGTGSMFTVAAAGLGTYTQTGGMTTVDGILDAGLVDIDGGMLGGAGSILADVVLGGVLGPGTSPGILTITGNYLQQAAGTLNVEIGGVLAGTQFDVLNISGMATLDGVLDIDLINSFFPNVGDTFVIMTFGSRSGNFANITGLNIGGGLFFQPVFHDNDLTLVVQGQAVPEPPALLLLAGGLLAWGASRRVKAARLRRRRE
jgi:hypothetical protein